MADNILDVTNDNFDTEVLGNSDPVLLDFWAPGCGPCRMLTPVIEELATDYAGRATVAKLNVDEASDVAQKYNVGSIPTVLVFKGGEVVWSFTGVAEKAKFAEILDQHLG
ncbi:MAG: thioredoxin [Planctomycetota bacterium]|nr:thioredoxin [Planctomycetota bacterium]